MDSRVVSGWFESYPTVSAVALDVVPNDEKREDGPWLSRPTRPEPTRAFERRDTGCSLQRWPSSFVAKFVAADI